MIELEALERCAEFKVSNAKARLEEYREKLASTPHYALDWGIEMFKAAANLEVWGRVLAKKGQRAASNESIVLRFADISLREAINGARWPAWSTEPSSNLIHECTTAAWADLYCEIMGNL